MASPPARHFKRFIQAYALRLALVCFLILFFAASAWALDSPSERQPYIIGFAARPEPTQVQKMLEGMGGELHRVYHLIPAAAVSLPEAAAEALLDHPAVLYITPDVQARATAQTVPWGITRVRAPEVWGSTRGAAVKVAVIDTGIDYTHPDLSANCMGGYDFVNSDDDPMDDNGHGTHVAGTVAALDNGLGVVGAAPSAHLYGLKVLNSDGSGPISDIIAALEWSVDHGMQVVNMSLGYDGPTYLSALEQACISAYQAGLLLVSSAGNAGNAGGGGDCVGQPARYASVIAVAATNQNDTRASFSSTGPTVELSAPGVDILSTYPGGLYATGSGTSMAAPHVAAVAALLWQLRPDLNNIELRQILRDTARTLGSVSWYGYGLVDAHEAVLAAAPPEGFEISVASISLGEVTPGVNTWPGVAAVNMPLTISAGGNWQVTVSAGGDFSDNGDPTAVFQIGYLKMGPSYDAVLSVPSAGAVVIAQGPAGENIAPDLHITLEVPWEREELVGRQLTATLTYTVIPR